MRYLLQNAQILSSGGVFRAADVLLSGGRIVSIGDRISCPADAVSIDLHKAVLFPGFVDVHVHLREPGFSYKETIRTGTLAAAHGGFAHVAAMPNLNPVPDCAAALAVQRAIIEKDALVHVHPYGAVSVGEKGERLADLDGLAPGVIAFSDDGRGVQSESLMREAMMHVKRGNPLGFFPAGAVAKLRWNLRVVDREWQPSIIRLIQQLKVPVVPIYFHGHNSLWFSFLGMISWKIRTLALPSEVFRKRNTTLHVSVGEPITPEQIAAISDTEELGKYLKQKTYEMRDWK